MCYIKTIIHYILKRILSFLCLESMYKKTPRIPAKRFLNLMSNSKFDGMYSSFQRFGMTGNLYFTVKTSVKIEKTVDFTNTNNLALQNQCKYTLFILK